MENSGNNRQVLTTRLVEMSVLAGCSYVLMFISFPIIPIVPYMKIDFSDMPILIGTVLFGPVGGMTIAGLKSILYWVTTGASVPGLIGVGSSFISSLVLIWAFYLANRVLSGMKGFKKALFVITTMAVSLAIIMSALNWSAVIPLYMSVIGLKLSLPLTTIIMAGVVPFNLIKGIVVGGLFYAIKDKFLPRLKIK
ncbi:ECF transporter S component [Lentilactobacillus sp. IMAU92037]|uniref:ECF transporter S component n=1 Tax=Lentilactobacillus TaxID=2767893 RepID=UPI001C25BA8D|nr:MULTISPECIES: ECF transporter S component [Lentilactobacillus]MBU9787983.1 ECF transporter S component [Lentilactobacillus dabitei]MBV0930097.1 ECF transporter S component [Lentilactobacillus dabitei]MDM7515887.1 ECF transporter S component [Lentilactobacillus sp. TOM.63]